MMFLPTDPAIVHVFWAVGLAESEGHHVLPYQMQMVHAALRGEEVRYPSPLPTADN